MKSEYFALSTSCKELFPLMDPTKELGCIGNSVADSSNLHIKIHNDSVGALTLVKLEPCWMTLRSKQCAIYTTGFKRISSLVEWYYGKSSHLSN